MWRVYWFADGKWYDIERESVNGVLKTMFNLLYGASLLVIDDWYVLAPDGSDCTVTIKARLEGR